MCLPTQILPKVAWLEKHILDHVKHLDHAAFLENLTVDLNWDINLLILLE